MLDTKLQSQLMDATSLMLRAYVVAATRSWAASASGGLALWALMLGASAPLSGGLPDARVALALPASPARASFANYRSDGGHAVAQIAVPAL